jgi:hypothetical protein
MQEQDLGCKSKHEPNKPLLPSKGNIPTHKSFPLMGNGRMFDGDYGMDFDKKEAGNDPVKERLTNDVR